MISDALKPLFESGVLNEATRDAINEAWESKLAEAKNEIRIEVREEFAERYDHDKEMMIESLDKMISDTLQPEIKKIQLEQKKAINNRVTVVKEMKATANKFNNFLTAKLAEEIKEFRKDRAVHQSAVNKLENFVMQSLAEEITEFSQDKQELVETKVRLIAEANDKFNNLKNKFVKRSAKSVQEMVSKVLRTELTQLHEDIKVAHKNNFGRKIFEAFASEFTSTHLNENAEMRKIKEDLVKATAKINEAKRIIAKKNELIENTNQQLSAVARRNDRAKVLGELMSPLAKDKQALMSELLEGVQTGKLRAAYDKYLPAVLSNNSVKTTSRLLAESREVTGNKKSAKNVENSEDDSNIIDIKRLAGLQ